MFLYILRRLLAGLVLAVLVTFITFLLLVPNLEGIVRTILGDAATDESVAAYMAANGFDRPVLAQYGHWFWNALQGDFGRSLFTSEDVGPAVIQRLGVTLSVVLVALAIAVLVSVALGVWAASRGGMIDRFAQGISVLGTIIPALLLAIVLVLVFAVTLGLLPAGGYTSPQEDVGRWIASITLPVIVLTIPGIANLAAQVRGAMIGELRQDYVRTLRTRGLPVRSIIFKHALRNAASPALTVLGFEFIGMLGGALIIERVFALPGYGMYAFNAALRGDIPLILGITAFGVLLVVVVNLVIDILNGLLIPKARIR
ncbi:ABC transporter permease [Arthrobacter sp. TMT4-20]